MQPKITEAEIADLAKKYGIEYAALRAVIDVEASGHGFDPATGKILIQFEPLWFKRQFDKWRNHVAGHKWASNKVGLQPEEWSAFNDAFGIDPDAAMESTSIGMMQVMGYHWGSLGFDGAGHMWDYAKCSESNQVELGLKYIVKNNLVTALKTKDWAAFARGYNGPKYKMFNYDTRLAKAYAKYKK